MNDNSLQSPAEIKLFLDGAQTLELSINKTKRNIFIATTLKRLDYFNLKRSDKSIVRGYLLRASHCSSAQLSRLIKAYKETKWIGKPRSPKQSFATIYTHQDILLLIETDKYHELLNGAATKKLFERAYYFYQEKAYERLKNISVAHIYNLRKSEFYQRQRRWFDKTKSRAVAIGERRKPKTNGEPGYIRIDTVHQGDLDKQKGVYHINAVDEVTQFEVICSVERISEHYLIPVLEMILLQFPFVIQGFHSDNGSEYINNMVLNLLNKLHVEFTKSRPRHSNDNGLVESKNGSIVRKVLGYIHIPQKYASLINEFNKNDLIPYINFHRPCFYPTEHIDDKGKIKKVYHYKDMMTPYEKLKSLPNASSFLRKGVDFNQLDKIAKQQTDLEAAKQMKTQRDNLFKTIFSHQTNK